MKKINFFLAAALLAGFASCDDDFNTGIEQVNPQQNIMSANGVTLAYGDALTADALDLNKYIDQQIGVINVTEAVDLPENATVNMEMQLATDADYHTFKTLKVTEGTVSGNAWEQAVLEMVGKNPNPVDMWIRFAVYADTEADHVRLGGSDFFYAAKKINVTPVDLKLPIENSYFLQLFNEDGSFQAIEMSHSARHPYDDPVFSALLDITEEQQDNLEWRIVSEKYMQNSETGASYGVSDVGDPADTSGSLMEDGENGIVSMVGKIKIEVNMLDLTYNFSYAFENMYTPGPANGWGFDNNMLLYTNDYINYQGFVYIDGEFKLTAGPDWGVNWGTNDGVNLASGAGNIQVDNPGLYWVTVNLEALTFTTTEITAIGMIGGFNNWDGDAELTPSADFKTWTGSVTITEKTEWKFRMNKDWGINLGGSVENLVPDGGNLEFPEGGTYNVTLNLGELPYSCNVMKQ